MLVQIWCVNILREFLEIALLDIPIMYKVYLWLQFECWGLAVYNSNASALSDLSVYIIRQQKDVTCIPIFLSNDVFFIHDFNDVVSKVMRLRFHRAT